MENNLHYCVRDLKAILKDKGRVKTGFCFSKNNLDTCNVEIEIVPIETKKLIGIPNQSDLYRVILKYEIKSKISEGDKIYKKEELEELFINLSKDFEKFENM